MSQINTNKRGYARAQCDYPLRRADYDINNGMFAH